MVWLDAYERRARLIPGLWLVAPVVVLILMFGLRSSPIVSAAAGLLTAAGGPVVLANFVRHCGLAIEPGLLARWGGWPTTTLLMENTPIGKQRRSAVARAAGIGSLSKKSTDSEIDAAVSVVRSRYGHGRTNRLVVLENRNYGYERNLLGCRPIGVVASSIALVVGITGTVIHMAANRFSGDLPIGLLALAGLVAFWLIMPSESRTHRTGVKYAERLFDAVIAQATASQRSGRD